MSNRQPTGEDRLGYDATASGLTGRQPPPERPVSEMEEPGRTARRSEDVDATDESPLGTMPAGLAAGGRSGWAATAGGEWQLRSSDGTEQAVVRASGTTTRPGCTAWPPARGGTSPRWPMVPRCSRRLTTPSATASKTWRAAPAARSCVAAVHAVRD
jgi:hypothetical protein